MSHPINNEPECDILSPELHDYLLEIIIKRGLAKSESRSRPQAIITGGQPASGKGRLAFNGQTYFEDKGGCVKIDADELRSIHPNYDSPHMEIDDRTAAHKVHPDASKWAKELLEVAMINRRNIVLDQVSADSEKLYSKIENLRANGYEYIELHVMAVSPLISQQGIHARYAGEKSDELNDYTGRFVPDHIHENAYLGLQNSVREAEEGQWVNRLVIYDRGYNKLVDINTTSVFEAKQLTAENALLAEQFKPFTDKEKEEHDHSWQRICDQVKGWQYRDDRPLGAPYVEAYILDLNKLRDEHRSRLGMQLREQQIQVNTNFVETSTTSVREMMINEANHQIIDEHHLVHRSEEELPVNQVLPPTTTSESVQDPSKTPTTDND